jgi:hypothetical protein
MTLRKRGILVDLDGVRNNAVLEPIRKGTNVIYGQCACCQPIAHRWDFL